MIERIIADDLPARMLFLGRHPKLHIWHFGIDVLGWRVRSFFSSAKLSCLLRPQDSRVSFHTRVCTIPLDRIWHMCQMAYLHISKSYTLGSHLAHVPSAYLHASSPICMLPDRLPRAA